MSSVPHASLTNATSFGSAGSRFTTTACAVAISSGFSIGPFACFLEASRASVPELQRAIGGIDDGRRVPYTFFASDANRGGVNVGKPDCREWQDAHAIVLSPESRGS